ncbi:hypothetical protein [Haloarcula laminariae]|nr:MULTISPECIES: hypothetical protein [Halomicroarcula]
MPAEPRQSTDEPSPGLTVEEREGAAARAVELVAATLAADG